MIPDPETIAQLGETTMEYGVEIVEEGVEAISLAGEGLQQTVHAVFYPIDTAEKIHDYFKGPDADPPPAFDIPSEPEEVTMRSSSVAHEDPPPPEN